MVDMREDEGQKNVAEAFCVMLMMMIIVVLEVVLVMGMG